MSAEPIIAMGAESPWVRLCPAHRAPVHSSGHGRHERLRCALCKDDRGRNKALKLFILRNIRTGQEIVCPVRADEGIEE